VNFKDKRQIEKKGLYWLESLGGVGSKETNFTNFYFGLDV